MAGPLDGIRVLDFTRYQQGPFATVMLGDLGAEVIKVEDPAGGDYGRRMWREADGFSAFWEALNRGKRSVCIDLRTTGGRDAALDLGATCDVVVENFRPGTLAGWGLGYDEFRAKRPDIIYAQATGWGTKGPLANAPSFDQIAQAYSGFAQFAGGGPGERPQIPVPGIADQSGAMNLAFGVVTALLARERTGLGQQVDVSLLGTQLALQSPYITHALHFGEVRSWEFRAAPTAGHYECADGRWVMIVGIDQKFWPRIAKALAVEELIEDARFARASLRYANRAELQPLLEAAFRARPAEHWLGRLRENDVPAAIVQDYLALDGDEQSFANGYLVERDAERVVGMHVRLSATPGAVGGPPPELGHDTLPVLRAAGFSEARIEDLLASGAIRAAAPQGE